MSVIILLILLVTWLLLLHVIPFSLDEIKIKREKPQDLVNFLLQGDLSGAVPKYKFFSVLVEQLLKQRNRLGCEITVSILEIRKALRWDIKFSKKIMNSLFGGIYQYLFISIFAWFFMFYSSSSLGTKIPADIILILGLIQILGGVAYCFLFYILKKRQFSKMNAIVASFYMFKSLLQISRPLSEVISCSRISDVEFDKETAYLKIRAEKFIDEIKIAGRLSMEDIDNLILELWDIYDIKQEQFEKQHNTLKLLIICFFGLPSFLFVISSSMISIVP